MKKNRQNNNVEINSDEAEFKSFFSDVLKQMPTKTSKIIQHTFDKSRVQAEKVLSKSQHQFKRTFSEFLVGVDDQTKIKCHRIIHAASLSAAIVGCSPIPFSDAFLLVPIQLTMMSRLHKLFGQSWSASVGRSLSKELVVVGLGRSAVGNIIKFVPAVGTVAGAAINASVAVSITEALGWTTVKMLNDGEDLFEQAMSFRGQFNILFKALYKSK
ncbi:YcjF family protein [Leuconostoc sp. MS02]|uniref:YcjF family protein n=1 Tax=Leuconostoc aquikimchii TaxID=3236804 RepID=A0ABV3S3F1_9LACO